MDNCCVADSDQPVGHTESHLARVIVSSSIATLVVFGNDPFSSTDTGSGQGLPLACPGPAPGLARRLPFAAANASLLAAART